MSLWEILISDNFGYYPWPARLTCTLIPYTKRYNTTWQFLNWSHTVSFMVRQWDNHNSILFGPTQYALMGPSSIPSLLGSVQTMFLNFFERCGHYKREGIFLDDQYALLNKIKYIDFGIVIRIFIFYKNHMDHVICLR